MTNSADPDHWLLQKPTDLDIQCLQMQVYPGSAGQGLNGKGCTDSKLTWKGSSTKLESKIVQTLPF